MGWEESMFALFDDLEQQAEGMQLVGRDSDVADLSLAEYSQISLGARLHASMDRELRLRLVGGRLVVGRLARVGQDWLLLVGGSAEWIVRYDGIVSLGGLSERADSEEVWSVMDRLSLRAVLRRLSSARERCVVHSLDDHQVEGHIGRVGRDFFELHLGDGSQRHAQILPVPSVAALQGRSA